MATLHETTMSLRFFGDELDPDEITLLLGHSPSTGRRKGEVWTTSTGAEREARTGSWRLKVDNRKPGDLDGQVDELFGALSDDLAVWQDLTMRFEADVFCGLFMMKSNEGLSFSALAMKTLSSRNLRISFDIYDPGEPD